MTPASADQGAGQQPSAAELRSVADGHLASCAADPVGWYRLLAAAAANPQHGFLNAVLIGAQQPGGGPAASRQEWNAAGWQVRKGQDARAWIIADEDAGQVDAVFTHGQVRPFRPAAGLALPGIARISAGSPDRALGALTALARRLGYTVACPEDGAAGPYTDWDQHAVSLPASMPPAAAAAALAHELAHILRDGSGPRQPGETTRGCYGAAAVEADSAAWLVLTRLGVDPDAAGVTLPPVRAWLVTDPRIPAAGALRAAGERVTGTARDVIAHAEKILADLPPAPSPAMPGPAPAAAAAAPGPDRGGAPARHPRARAAASAAAAAAAADRPAWPYPDQQLIRVNQAAAAFFRARLQGSWAAGYLAGRGFGLDICRRWQLGYAPAGWTGLRDHLHKMGYPDEVIEAAGLASRSRTGGLIDFFRDRVIIPVRGLHGQIAGFAGRAPDDAPDGTPKYINTPGTSPAYSKDQLLYGLPEAAAALHAGARPVLVEGYLDTIAVSETGRFLIASGAPVQAGMAGVAPGGTSLSEHQIGALAATCDLRVGTPLLVALDPDAGGQGATVRDYQLIAPYSPAATTPVLPDGADPAEIFGRGGPQALAAALAAGEHPLADVAVDAVLEQWQGKLHWAESQVGAMREVARLLVAAPPADPARQIVRVVARIHQAAPDAGVTFADMTGLLLEALEAAGPRPKDGAVRDGPGQPAAGLDFPSAPAPARPRPGRPAAPPSRGNGRRPPPRR